MSGKTFHTLLFLIILLPLYFYGHKAIASSIEDITTYNSIYPNQKTFSDSGFKIGIFDFIDRSLILLFKFYQSNITDIDDQTCPMQPTCSNFALQAVEKFGFLIGSLKTFDRLHRCSHDLEYYEIINVKNRNAYKDYP